MIRLMNNADDEEAWISKGERDFLTDKYNSAYRKHAEMHKKYNEATKELYDTYQALVDFYEAERNE